MKRKPTIVVVLFDQKSNGPKSLEHAKLVEMSKVPYTASGIIRYCARLKLLPGPDRPPVDIADYITRGGEVGAVAFENFLNSDLPGMARELQQDAKMASTLKRPWIHGCVSIDVSPQDFDGNPNDLLSVGENLMKMFGVDKNRYMLAVHLDSENIHVHFLYSRTDAEGRLRERDRKMPKFMAEEATALLAHRFGFELAPHHLSRVTAAGILDLASDCIVRDHNFVEQIVGMKRRNTARKRTKGNELLTLALVARHEARDLQQFRSLLAPHGIGYEKSGSGAEFIDNRGERIKASVFDRRLSPTSMFNGALLHSFPDTPQVLSNIAACARADAKLAHDLHSYATLADDSQTDAKVAYDGQADATVASTTPPSKAGTPLRKSLIGANEQSEIDRFFDDRTASDENTTDAEKRWDAAAVATMKSKPGRPGKDPIAPGWPTPAKFHGCLGSHEHRRAKVQFSDSYKTIERSWQTEVWREGQLVASIRYSRMAIVSHKEEDLREALRAAHIAWGTVEVFGKPKFKKQMAKLAAEINIPISNPELQAGIAQKMKAMKKHTSVPSSDNSAVNITPDLPKLTEATDDDLLVDRAHSGVGTAEPRPAVEAARQLTQPKTSTSTPVALPTTGSVPHKTLSDVHAGNGKSASTRNVDYLPSIKSDNWAVRRDPNDHAQMTIYQKDMTAFCVQPGDLQRPEVQAQLFINYKRQQAELADLSAAVRDGIIPVLVTQDIMGRKNIHLGIAPVSPLNDIYQRCMFHPQFETIMKLAHGDAMEARRAASQAPAGLPAQSESGVRTAVQPPTPRDEVSSNEQQYVQNRPTPEDSTEQGIGRQRETPSNAPSMDVLVEKHERTNDPSGDAITKPADVEISNEQHAAKLRSAIEEEVLHVILTERIRLERVDGALVLPAHDLIPAEWQYHAPHMQVQLEEGHQVVEDELKSCANLICTEGYDPTCHDQKLLHKVFRGQPEIVEALAERQRKAAQLLAQQHALAANHGFGFS